MEKKYELTDESITIKESTLYRIKALKDFSDVKKGDLGGFIESEDNLSQLGDCWVYNDAKVYNSAIVYENARIEGLAEVYGNARVSDSSKVHDNAKVFDNATISDNAKICDNAKIYGNACISDYTYISGNAEIYDHAIIHGMSIIGDNSKVYGYANVYNRAEITGNAEVYENASVYGDVRDAKICGNTYIGTYAYIKGYDTHIPVISSDNQYAFIGPGSGNITMYKYNNIIYIVLGNTCYTEQTFEKFLHECTYDSTRIRLKCAINPLKEYINTRLNLLNEKNK